MTRLTCAVPMLMIGAFLMAATPVASDDGRAPAKDSGAQGDHACCKAKPDAAPDVAFEYMKVAVNIEGGAPPRRERPIRFKPYKEGEVKNGGEISGTITFDGDLPEPRKLAIVKDQETCGQRDATVPLIRTNDKKQVADAVIFIADIREGKSFDKRAEPPLINQHHCEFVPHVQAVRLKEDVAILNSDPVAHNIKADQRIYTLFNVLQPQQGMKSLKQFDKSGLVSLHCNVHDWMQGWLWVFPHPYHAVTGEDGSFAMKNVPPGKYELVIWQEHLGSVKKTVEVKAGETVKVDVVLKAETSSDDAPARA